jgi:hypothetical protein
VEGQSHFPNTHSKVKSQKLLRSHSEDGSFPTAQDAYPKIPCVESKKETPPKHLLGSDAH